MLSFAWRQRRGMLALMIASMGLAACKPGSLAWDQGQGARHGRYVGVGIYGPGDPWAKLAAAPHPADAAAASTTDDQAIIVVVDSDTGEVRACGDMSGYCIGMNPWKTALQPSQVAPVDLTGHAQRTGAAPNSTDTAGQ